jgi:hypothetical protein
MPDGMLVVSIVFPSGDVLEQNLRFDAMLFIINALHKRFASKPKF